jgi:putative chitinase
MDKARFYDKARKAKLFGPTISGSELEGIEEILDSCTKHKWPVSWVAYALATAYHETAGTMQPIKEYGGRSYYMEMYDISGKNPKRARLMGNTVLGMGALYCGRGFVQLTWYNNYLKAGQKLGVDLVKNPDLAMQCHIASKILIYGMEEGWFTGKKLSDYLGTKPGTLGQFTSCRRIINGTDKALLIAQYAIEFQKALT